MKETALRLPLIALPLIALPLALALTSPAAAQDGNTIMLTTNGTTLALPLVQVSGDGRSSWDGGADAATAILYTVAEDGVEYQVTLFIYDGSADYMTLDIWLPDGRHWEGNHYDGLAATLSHFAIQEPYLMLGGTFEGPVLSMQTATGPAQFSASFTARLPRMQFLEITPGLIPEGD